MHPGTLGGLEQLEGEPGSLNCQSALPTDPPILRQFPPDFREQVSGWMLALGPHRAGRGGLWLMEGNLEHIPKHRA